MSTSPQDPAAGGAGRAVRIAAGVVAILVVVVTVLVVVLVRADGPESEPVARRADDVGAAAYDAAFARVRDLTGIATDFGTRLNALATAYERSATGPRTRRAEAAYNEARTSYQEGVAGLGELPANQDAAVASAAERFRDQAAATITYGDDFAGVKRALTTCSGVFELDEEALAARLPTAHQEAANACLPTLLPLSDSPFAVVTDFAAAFATLLEERQLVYDGVFGAGSIDGEDGAEQIDASYARFEPALDALSAPDGLSAVRAEVDVTDSYQALYALLSERTSP